MSDKKEISNKENVHAFFDKQKTPVEKRNSQLLNVTQKEINEDGPRKKWDRSMWRRLAFLPVNNKNALEASNENSAPTLKKP